ncbi:MAG: glycosyltransferase family 2 protein [Myxococcaceae bacterium]
MVAFLFWCSGLLLLHTYLFYPLALVAIDALAHAVRSVRGLNALPEEGEGAAKDAYLPSVTLVVAAHNEVACIERKVEDSLALDYPRDRLQVLVGSDGSTDGTDEIVRRRRDPRLVLSRAERAGKTTVLNRCIPLASGEIVVLTDANTEIDAPAVKKLVRHFADPEVGAVCGRLVLYNPSRPGYEESAYWSYESLIKLFEGRRGAVLGANGGLYAIRRTLFTRLPSQTIVDDFVIPARILARGYRVLYEPLAVAREETTEDYGREFGRRARIAAGNFQSLSMLKGLLSPFAGFPAFAFWSHKVVRWCAPALMLLALAANAALLDRTFYRVTFVLQGTFYGLALAGRLGVFKGRLRRAASAAYYFVAMNAALAVGFWRFLRHTQAPAWERTERARV